MCQKTPNITGVKKGRSAHELFVRDAPQEAVEGGVGVRMARDGANGVASDRYSRSPRNSERSPRNSNAEPVSASPFGDEDAQFQARRHHHLRRCRRRAPTRPSPCFFPIVHARHSLALAATTLALHHHCLRRRSRQ